MEKKRFEKYYLLSLAGVLTASFYPLYMGIRVVADMLTRGTVMKEDYPKYIIPYTPISLALIVGMLFMPWLLKYAKRAALFWTSVLSTGVFFVSELLLETKVVVTSTFSVTLEDWQMYMCIDFPAPKSSMESFRETAAEILIGNYSPAFKMHFYVISLIIILTALNCFYGFAHMIQSGEKKRLRTLTMQAVSGAAFLGLCILACFTAFFRDGNIRVSLVSAVLMTVFFVLFGITAGIYAGSFLNGKPKWIFVGIPAVTASAMTTLMYIGEMILLKGRLYRFGSGFLFRGLFSNREDRFDMGPAPVDLIIMLASGIICACILKAFGLKTDEETFDKEDEL